jgi:hypothetical protein
MSTKIREEIVTAVQKMPEKNWLPYTRCFNLF